MSIKMQDFQQSQHNDSQIIESKVLLEPRTRIDPSSVQYNSFCESWEKSLSNQIYVGANGTNQSQFIHGKSQNQEKINKSNYHRSSKNTMSRTDSQQARQQQKQLQRRNLYHELDFYMRERIKDLLTIQQLLLSNQYQRVVNYIEKQLNIMRKMYSTFHTDELTCQKTLTKVTKDISLKSNIDEDPNYNKLSKQIFYSVHNIVNNVKQLGLCKNFKIPIVKKLSLQSNLNVKKIPFEADAHLSKNLAIKFIEDYKHTNGNDVLVVISRSVSEKTQGEYSLVQNQGFKSQISKLIEQFSKSKIRNYKSL